MSIGSENSAKISHYLGIDYGKSDVGLALADEETKIAFADKTIKNDKNFLQNLTEIIEQENVKTVIIGIPSYINRQEVDYDGEKLGRFLEKNLGVEVEYQNEMFTTKIAQDHLIEKHIKGIKRFDDQEAARIILQEWLDKN
ncbi:MAG: Holliday junction resolvase RuvX [Candidatus Moranbacteria bacterium]|nr:Holliday junction resolvase RuvX [Candidatus Moranbacteria bacterium]